MTDVHVRALSAMVEAVPSLGGPENAALVEPAKTLAKQMDTAGSEPSTRLSAAYLSALKDLHRTSVGAARGTRGIDEAKRAKLRAMRSHRAG